jgi:hypothetical protein
MHCRGVVLAPVPNATPQESPSYTCTLAYLDIRGNDVTDVGCAAITSALIASGNRTLQLLNLNGNPIDDAGGLAIAAYLQVRHTMSGDADADVNPGLVDATSAL